MTPIYKLPIDDDLLAAYLDGRLEEEQEAYVEKAIENSPELQWTVDRWIEMQICQDKVEPTDVESLEPLVKEKVAAIQESPEIEEEREVAANRKLRISRIVYMAASILLLIGISLPLLIKQNRISPEIGMPMDFPAGELVPMEYSGLPDNPPQDRVPVEEDDGFSYKTTIYKSALIVMWEQRLENMEYVLYSSNGTKLQWGFVKNAHTESIGLSTIDDSNKPLWVALKFSNPDFYYADSIMVNY